MLKQIVAATVLVAGFSPAHADGLTPAAPAAAGTCYASGSSGPTVPCLQQGTTWVQVVRPTDDASTMTTSLAGGGSAALGSTVPTLDIARSEIGSRTISLRSFTVSGFAVVGDGGAGARYVRGTSAGLMAIQDAAGTWFQIDLSDGVLHAAWLGVVANSAVAASSNATAINVGLAALGARGGGVSSCHQATSTSARCSTTTTITLFSTGAGCSWPDTALQYTPPRSFLPSQERP